MFLRQRDQTGELFDLTARDRTTKSRADQSANNLLRPSPGVWCNVLSVPVSAGIYLFQALSRGSFGLIVWAADFDPIDTPVVQRHSSYFRSALLKALFEFRNQVRRSARSRFELGRRRLSALGGVRTVIVSRQPF